MCCVLAEAGNTRLLPFALTSSLRGQVWNHLSDVKCNLWARTQAGGRRTEAAHEALKSFFTCVVVVVFVVSGVKSTCRRVVWCVQGISAMLKDGLEWWGKARLSSSGRVQRRAGQCWRSWQLAEEAWRRWKRRRRRLMGVCGSYGEALVGCWRISGSGGGGWLAVAMPDGRRRRPRRRYQLLHILFPVGDFIFLKVPDGKQDLENA